MEMMVTPQLSAIMRAMERVAAVGLSVFANSCDRLIPQM